MQVQFQGYTQSYNFTWAQTDQIDGLFEKARAKAEKDAALISKHGVKTDVVSFFNKNDRTGTHTYGVLSGDDTRLPEEVAGLAKAASALTARMEGLVPNFGETDLGKLLQRISDEKALKNEAMIVVDKAQAGENSKVTVIA